MLCDRRCMFRTDGVMMFSSLWRLFHRRQSSRPDIFFRAKILAGAADQMRAHVAIAAIEGCLTRRHNGLACPRLESM